MRKLNILIIQLFVGATAFSQNCDFSKNSVEADHLCNQTATQLQTGNATIIARDAVILKPGFEITTANLNGKGFNATTNHSIVAEPTPYAATGTGGVVTLPEYTGFIPATLGGVVDVSPTGAATYQIPIQVSPGSNGMQPNLSIVYSSQSGNGLLGMGWNLSGLSAISRENKNQYYDNTVGPITLGVNDALSLDGTRLIYNSTLGGYSPVNNPYVKVVFSNNEFTVTTQDGVVLQYGATSNSKFKAANATVPHTWALNRTIDPNGNYIDYIYSEDLVNGEYHISEIKYTGNTSGKAPYNSVKFYYDLRNDPSSAYIAGYKMNQTALLTGIKIFCEGTLSKYYEFAYSFDFYSKLQRLTLTADGVKYAPTVVNWGTTNDNASTEETGVCLFPVFADFNYDGIPDRVDVNNGVFTIYINEEPYIFPFPKTTDDYKGGGIKTTKWTELINLNVVDQNGDGKDELVAHFTCYTKQETYGGGVLPKGSDWANDWSIEGKDRIFKYSYNNGSFESTFISETQSIDYISNPPVFPVTKHKYYYADLNNDGYTDRMHVNEINNVKRIISFDGITVETIPTLSYSIDDVWFIDFDGDGGLEIVFINLNGSGSVWKFNGTNLQCLYSGEFFSASGGQTHIPFYPGDFNNDGKTDFISRNCDSDWFIKYSTGSSYVAGMLPAFILEKLNLLLTPGDGYYKGDDDDNEGISVISTTYLLNTAYSGLISTADINNDGLSDITFASNEGYLLRYLNNGTTFIGIAPISILLEINNPISLRAVDLDNDGQVDFMYGHLKISFNNLNEPNFVSSIFDSLGNQSQFTYSFYTSQENQSNYEYPTRPMRGPLKVVSNLKTITDAGTASNATYTYSDGYQHLHGLGFLGFSRVESTDEINGLTSRLDYLFEVIDNIYSPWVSNVTTTKWGVPIANQSYTMMTIGGNISNKLFLHVPYKNISIDEVRQVTTVTENTYDTNMGRLATQMVTTGNWSSNTNYVYAVVNGNTSRLLSATTATTHAGDNFTSTQVFGYDPQNPFMVNRVTAQGKVTNYTSFDSYGNVTGASLGARHVSGTFDSKGRFMESLTNVQGLTSRFTYRYSNGMKLSETNPNGLTVTHSVVPTSGVLTVKTTNPDGNIVTNTLGWSNSIGKYFNTSTVTNGNTVTAYYNSAGQPLLKTSLGFEGVQHSTSYSYNSLGQLSTELTSGITTPTTYTYDNLGRIASISGHNSQGVSYQYGQNWVKTTSSVTGTETKTFDAAGNITSLVAPTGTIEYSYYASGNVKQLITEGAITQMTYDSFGNQLSLTEPNTGVTSYSYNEFNELLTQSNSKGTTTIDYVNGLVKSITGSDYSKVYTYYDEPGKKGLLKSVSRGDVVETYNYDNLCRLTSTTITDGTNTFTTTQQFNSKGQVEQTAYPTGLTAAYAYDAVGNLKSITDIANPSKAIWTGVAKNERDDWTSIALGNGLSTTYEYSPSTYMLKGIKTGAGKAPQFVQNLGFTFNTKGQLEQRTEGALTETFSYDDVNRLTREKVTNGYDHTVAYQSNGNIETATAAGVYTYLSEKPHAVESITGDAPKLPNLNITTNSQFTSDGRIQAIENKAYKNTFTYGPSGMRFKVDRYEGATKVGSKIYVGNSEFLLNPSGTIDTARTMVYAPTGICAVYEKVGTNPSKMFYIHTDYLGSWLAITNQSGKVENRYSYDAWGRPRNPNTWAQLTQYPVTAASLNALQPRFGRGYTGHEHMASFGLINMNGRVYDPYLQRFVSPDPHVTDPSNPQNHNRYSYCLNNPLMYTDPSGYDQQLILHPAVMRMIEEAWKRAHSFVSEDSRRSGGGGISFGGWRNYYRTHNGWANILIPKWSLKNWLSYPTFRFSNNRNGDNASDNGVNAIDSPSPTWHGGNSMEDFAPVNPGGNTAGPGGGSGGGSGSGGSLSETRFFSNIKDAYKYMWKVSHNSNGNWNVETSAWIVQNGNMQGVIVLPNNNNGVNYSLNNYLSVHPSKNNPKLYYVRYEGFGGGWYKIIGHIHTHPFVDGLGIGISGGDKKMASKVDSFIIWHLKIWKISPNGNYREFDDL